MTVIVEQIVTADGFAAEPDGGMRFAEATPDPSEADTAQIAMLADVDAIVLGLATYEMFASYWPTPASDGQLVAEPIARLPKLVVSSTLERAPWGDSEIEILRPEPDAATAVRGLADRYPTVIIWGSLTLVDALLEAGAVDRLRLRIAPLLIGQGRGFTPAALGQRTVRLTSATPLTSGHVISEYALG